MKILLNQKCGFTMAELLVAAVIFTTVAMVAALYMGQGMQAWEVGICKATLQSNSHAAMHRIINGLKSSEPHVSISEIEFVLPDPATTPPVDSSGDIVWSAEWSETDGCWVDGTYWKYWLDSSDPDKPLLTNTEIEVDASGNITGQTHRRLCPDVNSLTFTEYTDDGEIEKIEVFLGLQKTTSHGRVIPYTLTSYVNLRN